MFKARQKRVSLLVACLTALCAMFFAFVGIFSVPTTTASAADAVAYSYTFTSTQFSANGSKTLNNVKWTLAGDGGYWGYDGTKGQQFGSGSKPYKTLTLTSDSFTNVTEIKINTSGASSTSASLTVYVDNTQVGSKTTLTSSAKEYTFTPEVPLNGAVKFSYTQTSKKAIYIKSIEITYGAAEAGGCAHENKTQVANTPATCTDAGSTVYQCDDCGEEITEPIPAKGHSETKETTIEATCAIVGKETFTCTTCGNVRTIDIPKTNHNYQDGFCTGCNAPQPLEATLTFDDTAKRTAFSTSQQVWEENGITLTNNKGSGNNVADYSNPARFYKGSNITIEYPNMVKIDFNCSGSDYSSIPGATKNGNVVTIVLSEPTDNYTITLSDGQVRLNSLTVYAEQPKPATKIDGASLSIGSDLSMNYYVSNATESMVLYATFNGETFDLEGTQDGDRLKYTLTGITPKEMCDNISVVLMDGETEIAKQENYSIKTYAQNKLDASDSSEELKQLLVDLLYYGAASQNYMGYNTDNLASDGVENNSTAMPTDGNVFSLVNSGAESYPVYFKGANVEFGDVNKIIVKLSAYDENVTLTVNGEEVELNSATYKTEGILATGFATEYTFVLSYDGNVMQTLTYSVNSYAVRMQNNDDMGELAIALYRYGASAIAYKNA